INSAPLSGDRQTLHGRHAQLRRLREVWKGQESARVLSFRGPAGVGKTALIDAALNGLDIDRKGCRVFEWSFYNQSSGGHLALWVDLFLTRALKHFGDNEPEQGWPRQKGKRLSRLVLEKQGLLVLDGLEGVYSDKKRNPGLEALLEELAADSTSGGQ